VRDGVKCWIDMRANVSVSAGGTCSSHGNCARASSKFFDHRVIEWVLLADFSPSCYCVAVVAAVGMWATPFALSIMSTALHGHRR
jgi:hypothetical protein